MKDKEMGNNFGKMEPFLKEIINPMKKAAVGNIFMETEIHL
jgi:hypothetical protein